MRHRLSVIAVSALVVVTVVTPGVAEVSDRDVTTAITRGVAFLKSQQDPSRGNWPEHPLQPGGLSALCTLALLNAGVPKNDPSVQKALNYLRGFERPERTYSVALRTMVFCAADPVRDRSRIRTNVKWLEAMQLAGARGKQFGRTGTWPYSSKLGSGDNSNTQFALLALNEAERVGVKVAPSTWRLSLDYWRTTQKPDGSWGYYPAQNSTGSMTCAGVASLVIAAGQLTSGRAQVVGQKVHCCGQSEGQNHIERGLNWLGRHFSVRRNPGDQGWLLYYLYALERVGRLTGRRFIGNHDWYREGAELLVREQDDFNGYWRGIGHAESNPIIATSLALLFLSKGRRPVVIAKARRGASEDWDVHSGGVPNLTRHVEQSWKRELTWQTVDLDTADVQDLLESPVLFLSGKQALELNRQQRDRLKKYIEQGGFIFAEACDGDGCNGREFDRSFRALMRVMFPDAKLRLLPPDHAVWYAEGKVDPDHLRPLYGIDACCRTSVVYCPRTLSCYWELSQEGRETSLPEAVRKEVQACIQIGQNVVAYATNRVLKEKLQRPSIAQSAAAPGSGARGVLIIPKLAHSGGSDDAPNALANLLRFAREKVELRALTEHRVLVPTSETLYEYPVLFIHGRRSFRWTDVERKALADYIENGGFLFGDAICASPQFASALRRELATVFPGQKLERIPLNHPLFSETFGGFSLQRVTLNDPQVRRADDPLETRRSQVSPLLEGLTVDGRLAVVFSPNDLSCALESNASLECKGYIRTDAAKIGANVILFALQQ